MAYQSLYRRYRPQRFAELRGQDHVTATLRNAVREGRVAHAYLFSGPRGTGKTSTARILPPLSTAKHPVTASRARPARPGWPVRAARPPAVTRPMPAPTTGSEAIRA